MDGTETKGIKFLLFPNSLAKENISDGVFSKSKSLISNNKIIPSVSATFIQYPLKLAWAATIHKCQGQTFDKVMIDMDYGAFAHGQTYVALSRVVSLDGLFLRKPLRGDDFIFNSAIKDFLEY